MLLHSLSDNEWSRDDVRLDSPSPWIPGVLSRLVETVGEQHEDTQSYVTDVMLCLHTTVAHLALVPQAVPTQSPQHAPASAALSPTHDRKGSYSLNVQMREYLRIELSGILLRAVGAPKQQR
uniref:Uncharacterized protein n=1 Tax=Parascaris equorum TaxID=6256 RepID=A0A914RET9_PAREQ